MDVRFPVQTSPEGEACWVIPESLARRALEALTAQQEVRANQLDFDRMDPEVGTKIREARAETGLGVNEFAARAQIRPATLSEIETNQRRPSPKSLNAIMRELRIAIRGAPSVPPPPTAVPTS